GNNLRQETYITKDTRVSGGEVGGEPSYVHVTDDSDIPAVTIPVGMERLIIDESSSEIEANEGGPAIGANNPDVVNVGMIFKCREDFKQHMAMYAIRNKFRFRNSRSAPGGMVLRCFSHTIADIHTEYAEGIGHRFKYMFLAMSASIEGYKFMRK
ncbi:unnamed protein product, partial [Brassica rapa subsp. trilocularis]